jgi:hypothetical protein
MAIEKNKLTAQRLREVIDYDPCTGAFQWKPRAWRAGQRCNDDRSPGSVSKQTGYLTIRVDGNLYQAHRLAWLHNYGEWPASHLDHKDGNRLNNRINNLRDVGNTINRQNMRRARVDSASGLLGAHFDKRRGRYFSTIKTNGKAMYLGAHPTAEAAHAAYVAAKRRLHAGCTI